MKLGKVIIADNHQNMLVGVRTLLENIFKTVFMVADEASLLEAARMIKPDLIIADLSLPITQGHNIVRQLHESFPEVKLIIISVHDGCTAVKECMDAGADGFVLKRTTVDDLAPAINAVIQGNSYISPTARCSKLISSSTKNIG